jgi:hypothetical protein
MINPGEGHIQGGNEIFLGGARGRERIEGREGAPGIYLELTCSLVGDPSVRCIQNLRPSRLFRRVAYSYQAHFKHIVSHPVFSYYEC